MDFEKSVPEMCKIVLTWSLKRIQCYVRIERILTKYKTRISSITDTSLKLTYYNNVVVLVFFYDHSIKTFFSVLGF